MNAVDLIPASSRRSQPTGFFSAPFLGLLVGLGVVLAVTVLYVTAHDRVRSRRSELAQVSAGAARWTAAASSYSSDVQKLGQRAQQVADVRQLAAERFDWSLLLAQLASVMPARAQLSSLQATPPSGADASSTTDEASASQSGIQLAACAASQTVVAQTMVALRHVTGIAQVTLSSSASNGADASTATTGCHYPVQFQVSLSFGAVGGGATASAAGDETGVTQ